MLKPCIGIDIGSSYLCAVQIVRTAGEFCIEKLLCTQIRRSTDSPADILRLLCSRYGFDRRADVAVSMPHDAVFFRNLKTDSVGLEQIREKNWSALEHNFPVEPEEIVAQAYSYHPLPDGEHSVLTAVTARESLHERLSIFTEAKIHPNLIESPIFAVHSTVALNHPEIMTGRAIIAYIDECYLTLTVTSDDSVLVVRNIPIIAGSDSNIDSVQEQIAELLSREAQVTWRKVFGAGIEQDTKIYIVTAGKISDYLVGLIEENLHCQPTIVDCCKKIKSLTEHKVDSSICVAEGLALRVLAPEQTKGVNFLEADNSHTEPALDLKKELGVCASLISAIAVFLLVGLFMRLSRLEAHYLRLKNETTEIFRTALPEEKNIVSPLVQLEQKLESFKKDSRLFASLSPTHLAPLDVLHRISTSTPSRANVKVDDILIADHTVRVNGTCDSFEAVYQWQRLLEEVPGFEFVDVKDIQKQPKSGIVNFTMLMSSSIQEK
jgi:Tfp pilus assembly protein PilN